MTEWREVTLGDLGEVNRGRSRHRPRNAPHLYGGSYPFIQTGDIKSSNGRITSHSQTYSEAGLAQSRIWPKGTMVVTIAANIAETSILTYPACFPDSVVGFIADPSKANVRFIEYLFRYHKKQIQHENVGTGSVQDNINLQTLERLKLRVPSLCIQNEIVSTLGALDDKIDLNRRMNETLEAMARALFRDWFVDFGPTKAKMEGCPPYLAPEIWNLFPDRLDDDGKPEGWASGSLQDLIVLQRGFDLPKPQRESGAYPVIAASGANGTHNTFKVPGPGVTTGRSGIIGNVFYIHGDFWPLNTSLWIKSFPNSSPQHAYFLLQTIELASFNSGSAVPTLNRNHIHNLPMTIPPIELIQAFDKVALPLFKKQNTNDQEGKTLAQTRDFLLPKLMSGEICVSDAEEIIEEVA